MSLLPIFVSFAAGMVIRLLLAWQYSIWQSAENIDLGTTDSHASPYIAYAGNESVTENVIWRNRLKITSFGEFKQRCLVLFVLLTGFLYTFVELVALKRYILPGFTIGRETLQNWHNSPCVTIYCPVFER